MYTILLPVFAILAAASPYQDHGLVARQFSNSTTSSTALKTSTSSSVVLSGTATSTATVCTGGATSTLGAGPTITPDTVSAFFANAVISVAAVNAPTPSGYTAVFNNMEASNNAAGYLGYAYIQSYAPATCASICSNTATCASFNIYFQRDPLVDPNTGSGCSNPTSTVGIKCAFWSSAINTDTALNYGQWRQAFHVVLAGSNGYVNSSVAAAAAYGSPTYLANAAIVAPYACNGTSTFLGGRIYNGTTFDAARCAADCSATPGCRFFNTYLSAKNNVVLSQQCALFSVSWPAVFATNAGQYNAQGDHFSISSSYSYSNAANPGVCLRS